MNCFYLYTGISPVCLHRSIARFFYGWLCLVCTILLIQTAHAQTYPSGFSQVQVASGIRSPTVMAFAPDGRIFVAEQGGKLHVIKNGSLLATPFVQVNVNSSGERGLIGIALDPNFSANGYIYLYHTLPDASRNRISRFTASGDVANPGSETIILNLDPLSSAVNHNGGAMQFGRDGKLYVAVGDNANTNHPQNLNTYHGKLLRINPNGSAPADNPFNISGASEQKRRVWAYGLRNPYTIDIQRNTGRIFVNDVGQNAWEEINDATAPGLNFGWPAAEGTSTNPAYTNPVFSYANGSGDGKGCAITGGVFFNPVSTNYPAEYTGRYFYQDYCGRWINVLNLSGGGASRLPFASNLSNYALGLTAGTDGNLYYMSRGGIVYKIVYSGSQAPVITSQPVSASVSEGQPASFAVSASGTQPLSYQWQKNGTNISGATAATYSIARTVPGDAGQYRVIVRNNAGSVTSNAANLAVTAFNSPPVAQISTPVTGTMYRGGETISFSGTATDKEDGTLPASAFRWSVVFHHDDHTHDGPPVATGVRSGSFIIPNSGETDDNVWYRIYLTVTDSKGLTHTVHRDILPHKSRLSFATSPAGLQVSLDGRAATTPFSVVGVQGIRRSIGVPSPQTLNGVSYECDRWQHGGSAGQTITTPQNDVTYTAVFKPAASTLPTPWVSADIGSVAASGSATFASNTFTVKGSGADIWNNADGFRYVYQSITGDGEIVARVSSQTNTDSWAKSGLMIRETLAAGSTHASVFVTPAKGVVFQRRTVTGSSSTNTSNTGTAPVWLKLSRRANTFTASKSADGVNWQAISTLDLAMNQNVYIGLAVTSHNDGVICTTTFTNVQVHKGFSPLTLEAERAAVSGALEATNHAGYTGTGFVDYINPSNDYIRWTFEVPSAGTYTLRFRYALQSGNRPLELRVNGAVATASLSFPATGGWNNWGTVSAVVSLRAGQNTVQTTAMGSSGANVDHLVVSAGSSAREGVDEQLVNAEDVVLFPNPVREMLTVQMTPAAVERKLAVRVLNSLSVNLMNEEISLAAGADYFTVPVGGYPGGAYIIQIRNNGQWINRRFVINR
jgi:glucose/arabinose dehydrogenase/regulation of enolase protein 1 (concanavalin A-like superfamily)